MRRRKKRLYIVAVLLFFAICIPVWLVRGCSYAQQQRQKQDGSAKAGLSVRVNLDGEPVVMDLEEYLVGVVAAEMPASFELEALKAQAVAARTYTARKLAAYGGGGCGECDICTDSAHCQAYCTQSERLENWGERFEVYEAKLRSAISATAGQLIFYGDEPIEAFFHSTSGGMTENSENAFITALPYLKSVESDEKDAPKYRSTVTFSRREFADAINGLAGDANVSPSRLEEEVYVLTRFESGRVDAFAAGQTTLTGKQLRKLLGLNSTNITLEYTDKDVTVTTLGYGHGVGMSQTGANQMAAQGKDYWDILAHYYTGVRLECL